ncbi:MAG: 30S ribosomal protein S8 [Eubacteriaceae bacterium]|jgi:small subunit ribosomal protein S8|nr:30S ribosomal protein S8 [Eubacteriaceae bacterium]
MSMSDPIADMLTRIRNANKEVHKTVEFPASNEKKAIADILLEEGYISKVEVIEDTKQNIIKLTLKYGSNKERVIAGLKKISKPGLRVYVGKNDVPKVLNGLGVAIISTSSGVITDKQARKAGIGGEVLCYVW